MTRILWIDLNSSYAHSSLALPAIHAQMAGDTRFEWLKLTCTINDDTTRIVARAAGTHPDIIAASCWLFTCDKLMDILARCRALMPSAVIIIGGPECLGDNRRLLAANPFVDCALRGEGEEAFPRWLDVWDCPQRWGEADGVCHIDGSGRYIDGGTARVTRFDSLAVPEASPLFDWSKPFVQLETTRGCFNTCAFCTSGGDRPVRTTPLESVARRIDCIASHGIADIRMLDRTFNYDPARAEAMLDIFSRYAGRLRFHIELHPGLLTDRLRRRMESLPPGLLHIEAGIQSLDARVIEASRRRGDAARSVCGLRELCAMPGVVTHADLIAGLPHSTLQGLLHDVRELASYGAGEIQLETLKVLPGTIMRADAEALGLSYSPRPPYEVLMSDGMTPDDLVEAIGLSWLLDAYYNTEAWQDVTRSLITGEDGFLTSLLSHLTAAGITGTPLSLERRGMLLYDFCKAHYPSHSDSVTRAWIEAGMSLKKAPAERVITRRIALPDGHRTVWGKREAGMRYCFLPDGDGSGRGTFYGYPTDRQSARPTFKAEGQLCPDSD